MEAQVPKPSLDARPGRSRLFYTGVILISLLLGSLLRTLYLTADPPNNLSISGAILGDPGQYSYGARNLVLFDKLSFSEFKPHAASPLGTFVNYIVYRLFGISYFTHRIIPVTFSIGLILLLALFLFRHFDIHTALFSTVFLSFNYPLVMFSKVANRKFPMLLFFILAAILFVKGIHDRKNKYLVLSSLCLVLSLLTKASMVYVTPVFGIVSLIALLEKKTRLKNLLYFYVPLGGMLALCWWLIYLPSRKFLSSFMYYNSLIRRFRGLGEVLENMLKSPFLFQFRSEPFLLLLSLSGVFVYLYRRLKEKQTPLFIDFTFWWLAIGMFFNGVFSYRPIRFYLDLIIPAAVLFGWGMSRVFNRKVKIEVNVRFFAGLALTGVFLVLLGIYPYVSYLLRHISFNISFIIMGAVILILFLLQITLKKKIFGVISLASILLFSAHANIQAFLSWSKSRTYQLVNISNVLKNVIPPSMLAGHWASILSTGTRHKTVFAWPNVLEWTEDFLDRYQVKYLLVSDFAAAGYHRAYLKKFKKRMKNSQLMARFGLYRSNVFLYDLEPRIIKGRYEAETFVRQSGRVIFDREMSQKMGVLIPESSRETHLETKTGLLNGGQYDLVFKGKGRFWLKITLLEDETQLWAKTLMVNHKELEHRSFVYNQNRAARLLVKIQMSRLRGDALFDYLEISPRGKPPGMIRTIGLNDQYGNRRSARLFAPAPSQNMRHLLVYFHGVISDTFKKNPALKGYTGSPVEETGLIEFCRSRGIALLVPQTFYPYKFQNHVAYGWDTDKEPEGIEKIIDRVMMEYRIPKGNVFLAGISAGAVLTHFLANRRPDIYGGILSHSQGYTDKKGVLLTPARRGPAYKVVFAYNKGDYKKVIENCIQTRKKYESLGYQTNILKDVLPAGHQWSRRNNEKFWELLTK